MNGMKSTLFLLVFVFGLFNPELDAEIKKVAQTGYQFLKIDTDARAAAMGGANLMVGTGANAIFYNPAGMTEQPASIDFFSTQTNWIADISYFSLGISKNLGRFGFIGFSMQFSDYGQIIGTRVADNDVGFIETGNVSVGGSAFGISYAKKLTDQFAVGGQVKFVSQNLGDTMMPDGMKSNKTDGLAYDFGTLYYPGLKSFRFGMGVRNFSKEFKYEDDPFTLPLTFTIGAALDVTDFYGNLGEDHHLLLEANAVHPRDYTERINFGWEYGFRQFYLRGGYKFNHDTEGFSFGLGISLPVKNFKTRFEYSYNDAGDFEPVSRISLGFSL